MKVLFKILKGIVTVFLLVVLLIVIFQKITNNQLTIGNVYVFQVASKSMTPEYKVGDLIIVKKENPATLKVGDDVTYLGKESNLRGLVITHRIIETNKENDKYTFITKGIANDNEDPMITEDDIYGKVIYRTILFSFVGRLMTNIVVYYLLFISVAIAFSYEVVSSFIIKKDEDNEENK